MSESRGWELAFWALVSVRWAIQLGLAGRRALEAPRDLLTAALLVAYVTLGAMTAVAGLVGPVAVAALGIAVAMRGTALLTLRRDFRNSAGAASAPRVVTTGIYRLTRNPLVTAYWLELVAFTVGLGWSPLVLASTAMFLGVICAWHAREDNRALAAASAAYAEYAKRVPAGPLALFLPSRAIALRTGSWRLDTFAVYAMVAAFIGQAIAVAYGAHPLAFVITLPCGVLGALLYWRLTRRTTKRRIGFSFFGGLIAGTISYLAFSLATGTLTLPSVAAVMTGLAFAHAIGRIGCIAHGCCTGSVIAEVRPYSITYSDPLQRINQVRGVGRSTCTPAVVLELLGQLLIATACGAWPAHSISLYCLGYGALRAIIQAMRVETGEITRVLPAVALMLAGAMATTATLGTMVWTLPTVPNAILAIGVAIAVGAGFGVRRSGEAAAASLTGSAA